MRKAYDKKISKDTDVFIDVIGFKCEINKYSDESIDSLDQLKQAMIKAILGDVEEFEGYSSSFNTSTSIIALLGIQPSHFILFNLFSMSALYRLYS